MDDENKQLVALLDKLKGFNACADQADAIIYQKLLLQHYGMQSKLNEIILIWNYAQTELTKLNLKDIMESVEEDLVFFTLSLYIWKELDCQQVHSCAKELQDFKHIYVQWLDHMLKHPISRIFLTADIHSDRCQLEQAIEDYRRGLDRISI